MSDNSLDWLGKLEGERTIPLDAPEGELSVKYLTSLSPDSIKRHYPHLIVDLSPRRKGMKIRNVLVITGS
jgi:hypothetical protein